MKKTLISKESILSAGKEIVNQSGIQALNMRDVAQRCGIAVGSVYNYFPSKGDLIIATIESVWTEIMHDSKGCYSAPGFTENILFLFKNIQRGSKRYPSFFRMHPISLENIDKNKGREVMHRYFGHMKKGLLEALDQDPNVREDIFSDKFTKSAFVDFVFSNILTVLMNEESSCDYLLEIVKRTIYE